MLSIKKGSEAGCKVFNEWGSDGEERRGLPREENLTAGGTQRALQVLVCEPGGRVVVSILSDHMCRHNTREPHV